MTKLRIALAAAVAVPLLLAGTASAGLREECYRDAPFRLVPFCHYIPPGV